MQVREVLTFKPDNAGLLDATLFIPQSTVFFIDKVYSLQNEITEGEEPEITLPPSLTRAIFANEGNLRKKAQDAGLEIDIVNFNVEEKTPGMEVRYTIRFEDVDKFLASEIMFARIALDRTTPGLLTCHLPKAELSRQIELQKANIRQLQRYIHSEKFNALPYQQKKAIEQALIIEDFVVDLIVMAPARIQSTEGRFKKVNPMQASMKMNIVYGQAGSLAAYLQAEQNSPSQVVWNVPGQAPASDRSEKRHTASSPGRETRQDVVTLLLANGQTVSGKLVKETEEYIKLEFEGVPLTYYRDEIIQRK